jgi:MFS transporter, UMF1 family
VKQPAAIATRTDARAAFAWALYDCGNSAFATTVMAGFFPVFFKQYWSAGADVTVSSWNLGFANSAASVLVALLAPLLGALADAGRAKKRWLAGFALLGCIATCALSLVGKGGWQLAAAYYALATVGFGCSLVFYDALLVSVADDADSDRVSSLGYAWGYLGGGVLFALNVGMTLKPKLFGLPDIAAAIKASFVLVGLWWAIFTIPLLLRVRERSFGEASQRPAAPLREALRQLRSTFGRVRSMPEVWRFLVAYWLYIDGVDTIQRMAVDYGLSLGLNSSSLMIALLITQFVGFPAAIGFAKLASYIGTKRCIVIGIMVYLGVTLFGYFMTSAFEFYALAVVIGMVQGGVQALSRSFFSRLIPEAEAGEFFGFYNMLGKFAAVIGPALMGIVGLLTHNSRLSILSLDVLFLGGAFLLMRVDARAGAATTAS